MDSAVNSALWFAYLTHLVLVEVPALMMDREPTDCMQTDTISLYQTRDSCWQVVNVCTWMAGEH